MSFTLRPITNDELPAYCRACATGFGENLDWYEKHPQWAAHEVDRTLAAFEGDAIVGTSRNYSMELTTPGGTILPAAGVSAVAVLPTHTRRGILSSMMTGLLDDAVAREEPVAMLTASEGGIYGRFGFGMTIRTFGVKISTADAEFMSARPAGRLRMLDVDAARKIEPEVLERARRSRPGAISRPDAWWAAEQHDPSTGVRFDVVYESPGGSVDGFACYAIKDDWAPGVPKNRIHASDVVALTPEAEHALWRHLCEVDLVRTIEAWHVPADTPLPWMLKSARAVQPTLRDFVWTRLLDVPAALGARTYASVGRVTIEIHDSFRPGASADGVFAVEGGPEGAQVGTGGAPDLACDVRELSAAWLGGVRFSELAAAGLVEERTPGALATADAMFASTPLPFAYTWF